jgi:hypothetical protein
MIKKRGVLFITTITLLLLVICPGSLPAENGISRTDQPVVALRKGPYLIYPDENTEIKVLWQLWETAVCTLEWGFDNTTFPYSVETNESGGGEHEHQHSHTITSLLPGTKYYYRVSVKGQDDYYPGSFRAAPTAGATELKFMAYGDSRSYPAIHNTVAGAMVSTYSADPDFQTFVLSTGDLVYDGSSEADWDYHLLGSSQPNIQEMLANVPFHSCMGNHELPGDLFEKYLPYPFEAPRYWSFDYGPAHFVVVDQYTDYSPGSAQHLWIENDLASTNKAWKFIYLHEPGWSAGGHPNNPNVQDYIQPLCERYDVSMVFTGHNHYYSRAVVNGVHHVTTGGGGAPLYVPDPGSPLVVATSMSYHFCKIEIDGNSLTFTAVQPDGTVIDTFTILVSAGALWKYLDDGTDQGTAWREMSFDDSGWASGRAQLGYGDGDEATVIEYGPDPGNKYPCYYFRHSFNVTDASKYNSLRLRVIRDDGAVVYLNGVEVFRTNMPPGGITYNTWAASAVGEPYEDTWYETNVDAGNLVNGTNVIAVEVHQFHPTSTDISFDLQLIAPAEPLPDIKANDQDDPLFVTPAEAVDITISLSPGDRTGELADWWIIILTPWEPFFLPIGQIPLFNLPEIPLAGLTLPVGIYGFIFVLDNTPDGNFGLTWYDYVIVACLPQGVKMEIPPDFEAHLKERMEDLIKE